MKLPARILSAGVRDDVALGDGVTIVEPVNLYGCVLGDDVFVGPFTEIQDGAVIGDRTRVQSHTFVCSLVTVGRDCFIGHGVVFINDAFRTGGPAQGNTDLWEATNIGNHVSVGSGAVIMPVRICDHTVIGAGAVVTSEISEPGTYVGNPARKLNDRL